MKKIISHLNADGYFLGATTADPSPLEPGVYLIPAGAVDAIPPNVPEDKLAKWCGDCWVIENIPAEESELLPTSKFEDVKAAALVSVENYHAQQVQALVGNPTQIEKDTWTLKVETAKSIIYQTTLTDACQAFLISAGLKSDDEQKDWAQSVIAKSVRYSTFVGVAERLRDAARAAVKAAENEDALKVVMDEQRAIAENTIEALKQGS